MAKLHYVSVMSVDGYIGDDHYDWSMPADGSTAFITDIIRPFGTFIYGRKNYEAMAFWETPEAEKLKGESQEFKRVWQSAQKIVFSKTLHSAKTSKTRLEKVFDPQLIRDMKEKSSTDMSIGGPTLAGLAIRHGLVDEIHLFVPPATIGNRIPTISVFPRDISLQLNLIETRCFSKGWVYLHYRL